MRGHSWRDLKDTAAGRLRVATITLTCALAGAAFTSDLSAQSPVSVSAELNFKSQYFFAGIPFASGEVSQARVSATTPQGITLNAFSVYDYDRSEVTEFDLYGDYYTQLAPTLGLFVGAALYNFDLGTQWEATPEIYGGLVLTAPLNPTLYVAHDFDLGDGTHVTLMLSESAPLGGGGATLDVSANLDYNDDYYTVDFSGFGYADVGVGVSVPLGPITVTPSFTLLVALDDDFQIQAGIDDTEEVFGIAASMSF